MIKVLQITNQMYPHIGGIEQTSRDIELTLGRRNDIEQKIICFNSDDSNGAYSCKKNETVHEYIDGIEVIRCGIMAKIFSQPLSASYPSELKKVMNSFKPDIVLFHYPNPFEAQFLLNYKKRDFKLILYWHLDITKQKILGKLFHMQNISLLERADKIIATSPNYIEGSMYLSRYKKKCQVLSSCINPDRLEVTEYAKKLSEEIIEKNQGKTICFGIGRHVSYKGYTYLIRSANYLDDSFKIYIGGSGPLTEKLMQEAADCSNIEFLGSISDEQLVGYLLACDIFCFPSVTKNEAFGLALAEGMYFGKPAVTFNIKGSGVNYVSINGETGIECPNCDSKAYAEALKKLAGDPKLREEYGRNGRERVLEKFSFDSFGKELLLVIDNIMK